MKFTSIRSNGKRRFAGSAPLDVQLIKDVDFVDDSFIAFYYDLHDFQSTYSIDATQAYCSVDISDNALSLQATIYYIDNNSTSLTGYLSDYGHLECEIEIGDTERNKLILFLLRKCFGSYGKKK